MFKPGLRWCAPDVRSTICGVWLSAGGHATPAFSHGRAAGRGADRRSAPDPRRSVEQSSGSSQELCPSPAYRGGLKQALLRLADQHNSRKCHIDIDYAASDAVPAEIAAALYEASCAAVEQALRQGAARVSITVRGAGPVVLRIADDGRKSGRARALVAIGTVAREQGLGFECTTGKGTIVSIRYAIRRPSRG